MTSLERIDQAVIAAKNRIALQYDERTVNVTLGIFHRVLCSTVDHAEACEVNVGVVMAALCQLFKALDESSDECTKDLINN